MNKRHWRWTALLLSAALLLGAAVPGTLAYMFGQSNRLKNQFSVEPYLAPIEIEVVKTIRSAGERTISPAGFSFALEDAETGERILMTADAFGYARGELTLSDLTRTHTYRLTEINDGRANVVYSTAVHQIVVAPEVEENGRTTAKITVDGQEAQKISARFENTYYPGPEIPNTGDSAPVWLYGLMILLSVGYLAGSGLRRRRHS